MSEQTNIYKLIDDFRKEVKEDMKTMEKRLTDNQNRIETKLDQAIIQKVNTLEESYIKLDKDFATYKTEKNAQIKMIAAVWGVIGSVVTSIITAYIITRYVK